MAKSYLNLGAAFPIGIRRNNPGNLAKSSTLYPGVTTRPDTGRGPLFLAFVDMPHGLLAMNQLLTAYITTKGLNTITKMSARYLENGTSRALTNQWIADVSRYSGLPAGKLLTPTPQTLKSLCLGIAMKEVGLKWSRGGVTATITAQDYDEAMLLKTQLQTA